MLRYFLEARQLHLSNLQPGNSLPALGLHTFYKERAFHYIRRSKEH